MSKKKNKDKNLLTIKLERPNNVSTGHQKHHSGTGIHKNKKKYNRKVKHKTKSSHELT